jgi:hypothetical protein
MPRNADAMAVCDAAEHNVTRHNVTLPHNVTPMQCPTCLEVRRLAAERARRYRRHHAKR